MTALEQWRAAQQEQLLTDSDVQMGDWLASLTVDDVRADIAARMTPAEIALLRYPGARIQEAS